MKKNIIDIEMFSSLTTMYLENAYIDLHNEFFCSGIDLISLTGDMNVKFTNEISGRNLQLMFTCVEITNFNMEGLVNGKFIIDTIYRGRHQENNSVSDRKGDLGYIYMDFVDGLSMEFFSKILIVNY